MRTSITPHVLLTLAVFLATLGGVGSASDEQPSVPEPPADSTESWETLDPQIVIWTDGLWNLLPSIAFSTAHDEFLVGWTTEQDAFSRDIWARRVDRDGGLLEVFNVSAIPGDILEGSTIEYCPAHDEYLVAYTNWYQVNGEDADVQARRVAWDGGWMSDVFTVTPGTDEHIHPSIAYSGLDDEYVVVYSNQWPGDELDLYAQRIRASDGALLSWNAVESDAVWERFFSSVAYHPGAYGGAGGYLIAYQTWSATLGTSIRYKMTRSDLSDLFTNPELEVSNSGNFLSPPSVDAGVEGFLIAWREYTGAGYQVMARRLDVNGNPLGNAAGFPVSAVSSQVTVEPDIIAVAYTHRQSFLVLWNHENTLPALNDIHGVLVAEEWDGTIGDQIELSEGAEYVYRPSAICSPMSDCLIVYQWWNTSTDDIAGRILHLRAVFSDGFESGDFSAWSDTVP